VNSLIEPPSEISLEETRLKLNYIDVRYFCSTILHPGSLFLRSADKFPYRCNQFNSGTYDNGSESNLKINTKSFFNTINYSFPIEIGYTFRLATKRSTTSTDIHLFGRYEYDLGEIFKDSSVGSANISMFQVGLSLPFINPGRSPQKTSNSSLKVCYIFLNRFFAIRSIISI